MCIFRANCMQYMRQRWPCLAYDKCTGILKYSYITTLKFPEYNWGRGLLEKNFSLITLVICFYGLKISFGHEIFLEITS